MQVLLDYGRTGLDLDLTDIQATILAPRHVHGLPDEKTAFLEAARQPFSSKPLSGIVSATETLAICIPDITRPLPCRKLISWTLEELAHVPHENITIVSGTGSHRANTPDEWKEMVGEAIYQNIRCVDHDGHDATTMETVGQSSFGYDVAYNKAYAQADRRIIMGFIEPHFMAGFSGGYKAVFPGVTSVDAIMHYHSAAVVGDPLSTWGNLENNPTQDHVRAGGALRPVDFCVNITMNREREITGFFCGETMDAHRQGCASVKETAMVSCPKRYPIVITTNSGYPLDQNLYQTVKGMSAAVQIVEEGGLILVASRCNDGFPAHGNFKNFLFSHQSAEEMLGKIHAAGFSLFDQWQVQVFSNILKKCRVGLYSDLPEEEVSRGHMMPVQDMRQALDAELQRIGRDAPVAVMPEGPLTVPYLRA